MALFRRNKNVDSVTVPEEVNTYYQAERRDKRWMAWLLALFALAAAALVVVALFFGGRWAYRKFRPATTPTTVTIQKPTNPVKTNNDKPGTDSTNNGGNTTTPPTPPTPSSGSVNAPSSPATTPPSTTPGSSAATPGQGTAPAQTPATTSTPNGNLPNTGPGDVVAIFVLTSVAGSLVYKYLLRQTNN